MKILDIEHKGFKPYLAMTSDVFKANFEDSKVILVKGCNGSGKTTLFGQLSPLPADKNLFKEGGYEIKHIENNGKLYRLVSDFSGKSPKYSFIVDGVELNEAGIISAQRDLAYEHFSITKLIHDIMIGREKFTRMSFVARKKLFSTLTKLNIDHVLKAYSDMNDRLNMLKAILKTETSLLKNEEARLSSQDEIERLTLEIKENNRVLDVLMEFRSGMRRFTQTETNEGVYQELSEVMSDKLTFIRENYQVIRTSNDQDYQMKRDALLSRKNVFANELNVIYAKLEDKHTLLKVIEDNTMIDGKSFDEYEKDIVNAITMTSGKIQYFNREIGLTPNADRAYHRIKHVLEEVVPDMKTNEKLDDGKHRYAKSRLNETVDEQKRTHEHLSQLVLMESNIRYKNEVLSDIDLHVDCPECGTNILLSSLSNMNTDQDRLHAIALEAKGVKAKLAELEEYVDDCTKYFSDYTIISRLKDETFHLLPALWGEIDRSMCVTESPKMLLEFLNLLTLDYWLASELKELNEGLKEHHTRKETVNALQGTSKTQVEDEINHLNINSATYQKLIREIDLEISGLDVRDKIRREFEIMTKSIEVTKDRVREYNLAYVASGFINVLDEHIRSIRFNNGELETIVRDQDFIRLSIDKQAKRIKDIEEDIRVLTLTVEELSPKNGLIARTTSSFLNTLITNMNKTLERIWSYKMVLEPINLENDILNYKFKMKVMDTHLIEDISLASRGQGEAIDLAFIILLYNLRGMKDYPLMLDELAANMDEYNTALIVKLMHSLATDDYFSQIFIISHKENMEFLVDAKSVHLDE